MSGVVCPPPELSFGAEYYSVVNGVCTRDESFFGGKPVLAQAVGYAVVIGFGAFFAVFTSFLVLQNPNLLLYVITCHYHNEFTNRKREN
jgi:hypothetical protein